MHCRRNVHRCYKEIHTYQSEHNNSSQLDHGWFSGGRGEKGRKRKKGREGERGREERDLNKINVESEMVAYMYRNFANKALQMFL